MMMSVSEEKTETVTYKRRKRKGQRAEIMSAFPAEDVHYELSGTKMFCPDCHQLLKEIGSYPVRQELLFIPAQIKRLNHIQLAYKYEACSQNQPTDKIIKAPVAKAPLNHSYGSASIIAHSLYQKYEMKVPDYRTRKLLEKARAFS